MLKIPKSFAELQALNVLLKKYRDIYPYRIVICYVITYFLCVPFLQYRDMPRGFARSRLAIASNEPSGERMPLVLSGLAGAPVGPLFAI